MTELPDGFVKQSLTALPAKEREAFVQALLLEAPARALRLRPGVSIDTVRAALPGSYPPVLWARDAYGLEQSSAAGAHPLHAAGAYYLQEPSAMAAVAALDVRPGQRVLDLCAAPGGKSTQIAALLEKSGVLVSNEIVPSRAKILSQNIERLGVIRAAVTNESPDALARKWPGWFDRVLVDAPCSGEGMFRREMEARAQWNPQAPAGCAARQRQILEAAAAMLRAGGGLVYSTCTFNETENEGVIRSFRAAHPDFSPEAFSLDGVGESADGCLRLWPHRVRGEGHFVARLRKDGVSPIPQIDGADAPGPPPDFLCQAGMVGDLPGGRVRQSGDRVWLLPSDLPDLSGVRALRTGLSLGQWRGKRFEPDHALAMASGPDAFARAAFVSEGQARRYLNGETLGGEGFEKGWTVVSLCGLNLGWAKCADGVLKNHLPKGLRRSAP